MTVELYNSFRYKLCKVPPQLCDGSAIILTFLVVVVDDLRVQDCLECECDLGGSTDGRCNKETGACSCRAHLTGRQCSQPVDEFYIPSVDALSVKPTSSSCQPDVDLPTSYITGPGGHFLLCGDGDDVSFDDVSIALPQPNVTWYVQLQIINGLNS